VREERSESRLPRPTMVTGAWTTADVLWSPIIDRRRRARGGGDSGGGEAAGGGGGGGGEAAVAATAAARRRRRRGEGAVLAAFMCLER